MSCKLPRYDGDLCIFSKTPKPLAGYILLHHCFPDCQGLHGPNVAGPFPIRSPDILNFWNEDCILFMRGFCLKKRPPLEIDALRTNTFFLQRKVPSVRQPILRKQTQSLQKSPMDIHKPRMRDQRHSSCSMQFHANGQIQDPQVSEWSICTCKK